jgi:hypothetical protein
VKAPGRGRGWALACVARAAALAAWLAGAALAGAGAWAGAGAAGCIPRGDGVCRDVTPAPAPEDTPCAPATPFTVDEPMVLAASAPLGIEANGCDGVEVLFSDGDGERLRRSRDGGATFEPPRPLPEGMFPEWGVGSAVLAFQGDQLVAMGWLGGTALVWRSDDGGATFGAPAAVAVTARVREPFLAARGDEVVAAWWAAEGDAATAVVPASARVARSVDGGRTFGVDVRLDDGSWPAVALGHLGNAVGPALCLPGADGVAVAWMGSAEEIPCKAYGCEVPRAGYVSLSIDGAPFETRTVFEGESGMVPSLACFADGGVLAAWVGPDGALHTGTSGSCPRFREADTLAVMQSILDVPSYAIVTVGRERVLLRWSAAFAGNSGWALVDSAGRFRTAATVGADFDGGGGADVIAGACALSGDRFVLLSAGERRDTSAGCPGDPAATVNVVVSLVGADGTVESSAVVGELLSGCADGRLAVSCDARGRVHVVWGSAFDGGTKYRSIAFGP